MLHTHSEYVILPAFLLQQWLHERASLLHYTYIACHVKLSTRRKLSKSDAPASLPPANGRLVVRQSRSAFSGHETSCLTVPGFQPTYGKMIKVETLITCSIFQCQNLSFSCQVSEAEKMKCNEPYSYRTENLYVAAI